MICLHCSKEIKEEEYIAITRDRRTHPNIEISEIAHLGLVKFHISCFEYMAGKDVVRQIDYDAKEKEKKINDIAEAYSNIKWPSPWGSFRGHSPRCDDFLCDGSCNK